MFVRSSASNTLVLAPHLEASEYTAAEMWDAIIDAVGSPKRRVRDQVISVAEKIFAGSEAIFVQVGITKISEFFEQAISDGSPFNQISTYTQLLDKLCHPHRFEEHRVFAPIRHVLIREVIRHLGRQDADADYVFLLQRLWKNETVILLAMREFAEDVGTDSTMLPQVRSDVADISALSATIRESIADLNLPPKIHILTAFMVRASKRLNTPITEMLRSIGARETAGAMRKVVERRTGKDSRHIRCIAIEELTKTKNPVILPTLINVLGDKQRSVVRAATTGIATFGEMSIPGLLQAARENDARLSANATLALSEIGLPAVDALSQILQADRLETDVRCHAADGLGKLRAHPSVPVLIQMLGDHKVGGRIADALRQIKTPEALTALDDFNRRGSMSCTDLKIRPFIQSPKPASTTGMILIPCGEFQMGCNGGFHPERPAHNVTISTFYIDVRPVTVGEYRQFVDATGHLQPDWKQVAQVSSTDEHAMVYVSWYHAMAYAQWANKRLPTEAEWEYATRGGLEDKKYPWGDDKPDGSRANYKRYVGKTSPVASYPPNGYGLYDMAGNVLEWCLDAYKPGFYGAGPTNNPLAIGDADIVAGVFQGVERKAV